jgi:phospholipase C
MFGKLTYPFDHTSFIKTLLLWAGVDLRTVQLGKRMPEAPTFEGVLEHEIVNNETLPSAGGLLTVPPITAGTAPAEQLSELADPPAGSTRPVDALFEGVSFVATRAILSANEDLAGIRAEIERYRQDPDKFEAELG